MIDLPSDGVLYAQLDDYQPLTASQIAGFRARAKAAPEWFERFDLLRLAIACRPRDEDPLRGLGILLHDAAVRAHPAFDEFRSELVGAVGICRTAFQTEWLRACPCSDVVAELDLIPDAVLMELLTPAPIAALLGLAGGLVLGELRQRVRPALDRAGPETQSGFIRLLGPVHADMTGGPSDAQQEFDDEDEDDFDLALHLEAVEGGWSCSAALELVLRWRDEVLPWGVSSDAVAAFHRDVLHLLSLPPDLLVSDRIAEPD